MSVITVAEIKTHLGLADTTYDAALAELLPKLDAKVKEVTRKDWADVVTVTMDESEYLTVVLTTIDRYDWRPDIAEQNTDYIKPGQLVTGDGIPEGTYVEAVYPTKVKITNAATLSGEYDVEFGFNRAYHRTVAKLAWWMLQDQNTKTPEAAIASKSLGDVSITYAGADGADIKYGIPHWAYRGLPKYGRGV